MWNKITNPKTGRKVSINNKLGKNILNNYIKQIGGSALDLYKPVQSIIIEPVNINTTQPNYTYGVGFTPPLQNVPNKIVKHVKQILDVFDTLVKPTGYNKTKDELDQDEIKYELVSMSIKDLESRGRFTGPNSLNVKKWNTKKELEEWKEANTEDWFDPVTGEHSISNEDGYIGAIPGDVIGRGGVSGIKVLEHWGIYIGSDLVIEIIADAGLSVIGLSSMKNFIQNPEYPAFIYSTITKSSNGVYTDYRVFPRQASLWAASKTLTTNLKYGVGIDMNNYGIYDQTCQSYVNTLIFGSSYTTQIYYFLSSAVIAISVHKLVNNLSKGIIVNKENIKNYPNYCIKPCRQSFMSGNLLIKNQKNLKHRCECVSSCNKTLFSSSKPWCYVDDKCGKKQHLQKHKGRYYSECNTENRHYICNSTNNKLIRCAIEILD